MPLVAAKYAPDLSSSTALTPPEPDRAGGGFWQGVGEALSTFAIPTGHDLHPQVWSDAFQMENDVVNTIQLLSEPVWKDDPNFHLEANLKASGLWDEYRDNFIGVRSPGEFLYKTRKIENELAIRQRLAAAGPEGVVASFIAGAASPTILLPFVGPGVRGAKAIALGVAWGAAGGALQEVPLQLNQELRTMGDSATSVAFSSIVGGVLGGAMGFLGRDLEAVSNDMAVVPGTKAIPLSDERAALQNDIETIHTQLDVYDPKQRVITPQDQADVDGLLVLSNRFERRLREIDAEEARLKLADEYDTELQGSALGHKAAAGADVPNTDAGGLANMLGIGERLTKIAGPVTANLGQKLSPVGRRLMAETSTAGLQLEGNKAVLDSKGNIVGPIASPVPLEGLINARKGDLLNLRDQAYSNYADYWFGSGEKPGAFRTQRAYTERLLTGGKSGKMNRRQFFEEVGKAMWAGRVHDVPEVQKTAEAFGAYQDTLLKEAQDVGLISKDIKDVAGDLGYLNRVYDTEEIKRRPLEFLKLLGDHFERVLGEDSAKIRSSWQKAEANDSQRLADYALPLEEAQKLRAQFQDELAALKAMDDEDLGPAEQLISGYRAEMAKLSRERKKLEKELVSGDQSSAIRRPIEAQIEKLKADRKVYADEVARYQTLGGPDLEARTLRKAELKRRIRNMNRSRYMVEEKARKKFDTINQLEEENIDTLDRVVTAAQKALRATDKAGADVDSALKGLHSEVKAAGGSVARLEAQIEALHAKAKKTEGVSEGEVDPVDDLLGKIWQKERKLGEAQAEFAELSDNLDSWQNINWTERGVDDVRAVIQDTLDRTVRRVSEINGKRAKRIAKLEKDSKFDEAAWAAKRQEIVDRMKARREKTSERLNQLGDDNHNDLNGVGDFKRRAADIAEVAKTRVLGSNLRLPGFDALSDARGAELARTLSIPSLQLADKGFLVSDAEHLMQVYQNTMVPDIEITRRLGPLAPDGERNLRFKELDEEEVMKLRELRARMEDEAKAKGKPLNEEKLGELSRQMSKAYAQIKSNQVAVIQRLRNQWGLPNDPDGWGTRAAQVILGLQTHRLLGSVLLSQVGDLGKPIIRYGLTRTLRAGFIPLISNWKLLKLTAKEARLAHVGVESATAERTFQMAEMFAMARRKSKFEAGLEWSASKMGILFGFAPWTDVMKTINSATMNLTLMDNIDLALNSTKTSKDRLNAITWLNARGLSDDMQRRIWEEMQNGGAEQVDALGGKQWVPQTERWMDKEAVRSYRAALNSEASASIVTPGVELPKFANATLPGRLLINLKSFALSSTSKTLMAGLQQRDMALFQGVTISLALGALSYYLKATVAGGEVEARMRSASPEQWADEALNNSGLLGAIQLAQQIADDIPYLRNGSSIAGISATAQGKKFEPSYRASGAGLIGDLGGPTLDLFTTLATAITGVDNPTRATVHKVRQLLPLQNFLLLRRLFDQVENAVGDANHLTGQRR